MELSLVFLRSWWPATERNHMEATLYCGVVTMRDIPWCGAVDVQCELLAIEKGTCTRTLALLSVPTLYFSPMSAHHIVNPGTLVKPKTPTLVWE